MALLADADLGHAQQGRDAASVQDQRGLEHRDGLVPAPRPDQMISERDPWRDVRRKRLGPAQMELGRSLAPSGEDPSQPQVRLRVVRISLQDGAEAADRRIPIARLEQLPGRLQLSLRHGEVGHGFPPGTRPTYAARTT